ncbi:MAG TPA: AraC family transcriptional regulator [Devosia sp.]|nr:AraC family transcriptional regulator [Devosia sp.]
MHAEWLFSSGNCVVAHRFDERQRAAFRRETTRAYLEEKPVFPGIWLYRGEATARSQFSMEVEGGEPDKGRMILGSMLTGRGTVALEGCDERNWREEGRVYSLSPIERRTRYDIASEVGWSTVAVRLEEEALDLLATDVRLPAVVARALRGQLDDLAEMAPMSRPIRTTSGLLLRSPYAGSMRLLFEQAKVLELLVHLFDRFEAQPEDEFMAATELARVRMARDRLLNDLRLPPDLETLAQDVGLSPKRLNRGFRKLYGATAFEFLRDARLDAARAALEAGSPLTLKQLAWELGYGQVTNFVTAFRRRYGVSPGAYRSAAASTPAGRRSAS